MITSISPYCVFLLASTCLTGFRIFAQSDDRNDELMKLIGRADLTYTTPVQRSEEGMPVGNGTMGSLVWTTPTALHFQVNRVDIFAQNASTNNFYERHTDYCGGAAFVDIDFSASEKEVFVIPEFGQHLSCYNGQVTSNGNGIRTKTVTWMQDDVMAIHIEDTRQHPAPVSIQLRALRSMLTKKGNHVAKSELSTAHDKIILNQQFTEDDYFCASSVVVTVSGRKARVIRANEGELKIVLPAGNEKFTVFISSGATFDREADVVAGTTEKLEIAMKHEFDKLLLDNQVWWREFWSKSYVHLHSKDGIADMIEKNYTFYLYIMASSSRGNLPPKFNGMLWSTGGDVRKWGSLFWGANQSCLYNALFPTNHIELMAPMFRMYSSMYESCADAAVRQWGSKGIYIPETVAFDGLGTLPEDIAKEMQDLYLQKKPWSERSEKFTDFASTKLPFLSRWNWKKDEGWKNGQWHSTDKGAGPYGHVTHIFSRGGKIAYQYWLRYEYTKDTTWLRNNGYPMLRGVAEFYRNFPNLSKESDGRYHLYNINDNESVWGGHNTIEEISSMKGVLAVAIKASKILSVDDDLRAAWQELLENLPPLPTTETAANTIWKRSLSPVVHGDGERLPDPNTLPTWFFDLCNLEAPPDMKAIANATFDAYFPQGISAKQRVYVLSKLPAAGSLLGRKESTRYLIPNQIETAEIDIMRNRMDLREGEQTTSVQRLGRAAEAILFALCQSVPSKPGESPVIRIFPAWPNEWNAQFSLLCRGGFLVSSAMVNGEIKQVGIDARQDGLCKIRNPWPGKQVTIFRNDKRWKNQKGDLLIFAANKTDHMLLIPAGRTYRLGMDSLRVE